MCDKDFSTEELLNLRNCCRLNCCDTAARHGKLTTSSMRWPTLHLLASFHIAISRLFRLPVKAVLQGRPNQSLCTWPLSYFANSGCRNRGTRYLVMNLCLKKGKHDTLTSTSVALSLGFSPIQHTEVLQPWADNHHRICCYSKQQPDYPQGTSGSSCNWTTQPCPPLRNYPEFLSFEKQCEAPWCDRWRYLMRLVRWVSNSWNQSYSNR